MANDLWTKCATRSLNSKVKRGKRQREGCWLELLKLADTKQRQNSSRYQSRRERILWPGHPCTKIDLSAVKGCNHPTRSSWRQLIRWRSAGHQMVRSIVLPTFRDEFSLGFAWRAKLGHCFINMPIWRTGSLHAAMLMQLVPSGAGKSNPLQTTGSWIIEINRRQSHFFSSPLPNRPPRPC